MLPAFDKLSKILKLEQHKGYQNDAVLGGLEKFADHWRDEALGETQVETLVEQINIIAGLLHNYPNNDAGQRTQTVSDVLARLELIANPPSTPPLRKPAPQKPAPAPAPSSPPPQEPAPAPAPSSPPPQKSAPAPAPSTPPPQKPAPAPAPSSPPQPDSPPRPVSEAVPLTPDQTNSGLDASVTALPGISTAYAARLQKLGISTVADLIYHFPHRYEDYRTLKPINRLEYGEETTIIGTIWETNTRKSRGGGAIVTSIIADASGTIEAVWFNQPYLTRQLRPGRQIVLSGKVDERLGRLNLQSPAWEPLERELIHTGRLVPIYPLTRGITARWMRQRTKRVVDHWAPRLEDPLPEAIRERLKLMDLSTAIRQIHFPDDQRSSEGARHRLAFDEFLLIQLGLLRQREKWQDQQGAPLQANQPLQAAFAAALPFQLTEAQKRSLDNILADLAQPRPMSRMLQGDVGSGKTVVAAAAMLMAVASGKQAALMAPTEILAEQHYKTIAELLENAQDWGLERPISSALLTGSLRRVERGKVYTALASGEADIVVGTHALIQKHVTFKDLGLVIVDEQHRFGVVQRTALRSKGVTPHMLVMSATPIPRSLALTVYGDLDISVIDELPPGRQPIETRWLLPRERERAYRFLRGQIQRGRQVFMLYPLVEESDKVEAKAAVEEYERLQEVIFPDLTLGLLHGRMKAKAKDAVMARFHSGEIDILVSTSVIEVGIDVPNATVMMIEGADRFGLAQLHQFRGRVGRGGHQSYCLLLSDTASPDNPKTKATWERLKAIEETQDGFVLAEKDLELRGPGDFVGVRQSGLPTLRLANLTNVRTLEQARAEAKALFQDDPSLSKPEHRKLSEQLDRFWQASGGLS